MGSVVDVLVIEIGAGSSPCPHEPMSDYERKFKAAHAELIQAGIWKGTKVPGGLRLVQALGFRPRPPQYGFVSAALTFGIVFIIGSIVGIFGVFSMLGLLGFVFTGFFWVFVMCVVVVNGVFNAVLLAYLHSRERKKHNLSDWHKL